MNNHYPSGTFLDTEDYTTEELVKLLELASHLKTTNFRTQKAAGQMLGLVFFNSSLRTRVSFETAAIQLGASTSHIQPGSGSWPLETEFGAVMDGDKSEHLKEAIAVLARYCDVLGVRLFAGMQDYEKDLSDNLMKEIAGYSDVPVLNLESGAAHPFQSLADWLTLRELFGQDLKDKTFVLRWAPHPKALPMAVPNSALKIAARAGMKVVLNCPEEFLLDNQLINSTTESAEAEGGNISVVHEKHEGVKDADVVYVKSWGAPLLYSSPESEHKLRTSDYRNWTVDEQVMKQTRDAKVMHCLPVRRNVVISDEVLDSSNAVHIDQAENRMHVQKAWLHQLWNI